ncbi:MAG: HEAT repeat domain-containing protein, partial [Acidobacteria bacterium]|nr:HEAT repeat domain-containing protein [Acidobacteriota bacterium]
MKHTKLFSLLLASLLVFAQFANARPLAPMPAFPQFSVFQTQDVKDTKPLPPVNYIRSREIDVKNVSIDLRFDWDKEQAFGSTIITVSPFKDTDTIHLDAAEMQITAVTLGGTNLKFKYAGGSEDNNLEITLPRVYKEGEDLSVKVDYRTSYVNKADGDTAIGNFGRGLRFIKPTDNEPNKPRQIWSQGETEFNRYWFPSYDTPNDFRTSELTATVDKKYTVVSNGRLVDVKDNPDGTHTFHWKMDTPYSNYLTSIVVGEFTQVKNGEYEGIPVYAYGYPTETKEVALTTKNIVDMVKFFSEKTGVKYAYPKYSQTMVEDFGGGMENISATTQIEEMIHDERELLDNDSDGLQAHELAHQWFGDYVTTRDWGQIWLNESFATYFDALYQEHKKGRDHFLFNEVRNNQNQVLGAWRQGNRRPIVTKYYADKDAMFDSYAYPGGGSVLHMLRKHLGEKNWWKAINHYLRSNANQPVSTEDFRIAIEESTGQSMDWFFDEWLYKMGHPEFEITKSYDAPNKRLTVNVKQTQKVDPANEYPQTEFFQTFVDIEIDGRIERVWIKPQAENVFIFEAATEPKLVNFDYEGTLLKEMKFVKSSGELIYQLANDKDIIGRNWALGELTKIIKDKKTSKSEKAPLMAAIRNSVEKDDSYQIRLAAINAIGSLYVANTPFGNVPKSSIDEETVRAMIGASKDKNSNVRASAISVLSATKDAKFADLYLAGLKDRSYAVVTQSAIALAGTKDARAYGALTDLLSQPSWKGRTQRAAINGLSQLEDKRALDIGIKYASDKQLPANVRSAALALIGATGKGDPRGYPIILDAFKRSLETNDIQGVFDSAQGIIKLADPR